uniref:aminoglycoside phosphotransferase family protein n=1 Tax=Thaumasiovibrio occultus TaxID=1891184 RepID=UPI000B34B1DB|nr:aminoglycoside phosphotransferase family protein [Thaumasiovibrio occultus]
MISVNEHSQTVTRPASESTATLHEFLRLLRLNHFNAAPMPIALDEEHETLSLVAGKTFDSVLDAEMGSEQALISAARLLRQFHDASAKTLKYLPAVQHWSLPVRQPVEVICHGDFAPYNVALAGGEVKGVYDFDTAHPAPRVWDLAYALYCWCPFKTADGDRMGDIESQIARAVLFCQHYGADAAQREALVETMIARLDALISFMEEQAKHNPKFAQNIADGHHLAYQQDMAYLKAHRDKITTALVK